MKTVPKDCGFSQMEDDDKLKKRKERFGILTGSSSAGAADTEVEFHVRFISVTTKLKRLPDVLTGLVLFFSVGKENEAS